MNSFKKNGLDKIKYLTPEKIILLIQLIILLVFAGIYIYLRIFPSIEMILCFTILIFIWKSSQRALLKDLLPLFLLLLVYQSLRGFADNLSPSEIHITDLIKVEKFLFNGWVPAYVFQTALKNIPGNVIIIRLAGILYMSHFITPVIVAIVIWKYKKQAYWPYIFGLLILTYSAYITYIFFPAAPPWWATKYGYLTDQQVSLSQFVYPTFVEFFGPNPVAAMPSLHMAYPSYTAIFLISLWRRKILYIILLPVLIGLSTIILGHHYVIDLFFGLVYAIVAFLLARKFLTLYQQKLKNQVVDTTRSN